jgi:putative transcriptional regulator
LSRASEEGKIAEVPYAEQGPPTDEDLVATAKDMRDVGAMSNEAYEKITLRHLQGAPEVPPVTGAQIRTMRVRAKLSQGVFARDLNVSTGYLSQLERGVKRPTGAGIVERDQAQGL